MEEGKFVHPTISINTLRKLFSGYMITICFTTILNHITATTVYGHTVFTG